MWCGLLCLQRFVDWFRTAACYNMGKQAVSSWLAVHGQTPAYPPAHNVGGHDQLWLPAPHTPLLHAITVRLEVTLQVGAQAARLL
jgi:hypothetical protein